MKGRQIAGWALAASVLVGVPVGVLVPPLRPAEAQINPVLRGQKFLLWAVWMTKDESYAEAERLYRDGFETWGREDVTARLDAQQKESIPIFRMFAESNQRLLRASQQSANALKSEQKAFDRLWQRYQSWLNRTEADLEQARGIPLFAGTAGVPKLQKLSLVRGRVELGGTNNPVPERGSRQVSAVSPRNVTQNPVNHRETHPITKQSSKPSVVQGKQWDTAYELFRQAEDFTNKGEYAEAEPLYQRALAIINQEISKLSPQEQQVRQSAAQLLTALAGINRGLLYASQGKQAEANRMLQTNLQRMAQILGKNDPQVVKLRQFIATYTQQQKKTPQRTTASSSALQEADRLHQLGIEQYYKAQYAQALESLQQSLAIREKRLGSSHLDVAHSLYAIARMYIPLGRHGEAEALYQKSLAIKEKMLGANHPEVGDIVNSLGILYLSQNNYKKALPMFERSLKIFEKSSDLLKVSYTLENLSYVYSFQGEHEQVVRLLNKSLSIKEKIFGSESFHVAYTLSNIAGLHKLEGNNTEALRLYKRALSILEREPEPQPFLYSTILSNIADIYTEQENYIEALRLSQLSLDIQQKILGTDHHNIAYNLEQMATLYQLQNDYIQALNFYQHCTEIQEKHLSRNLNVGSEEYKRKFLEMFKSSTNRVISFHLQFARTNPEAARLALTTILRRKGRVLDTLSQNLNRLRQQLSPADQERLTRLSALRTQAAQIAFNPNPTDQQRQQFQLLNTQAEQIETELNRSNTTFAQTTQPVTLEAVQKAIPANAALVEFIEYQPFNPKAPPSQRWGSPRYAVYVLTATGEPRFADLGSASEIDALVSQYYNVVRDSRLPREPLRNLDAKIMAPVRQLVGSATHLLIAPDGQLNLVSFAGLMDEKNQYLIEKYQITYLTSGRDLLRLQTAPPKANPPLIVANPTFDKPGSSPVQIASADRGNLRSGDLATLKFGPLPATAIEGETIAKLLPNSRLFTQAQATETVVKSSSNPRILHLATHGFFLKPAPITQAKDGSRNLPSENPLLRSGLAFSGFNVRQGGGDDGVLTALEITGMDLRGTQLVVLSACETGLGDVQSGEGVYGLRRAFTLAGAQSQVMTLWRVDDNATKDLMVNYYQRLAKGEGRGEALRQAQLAMLRSPNYAHPKYWSGMIPVGDWRGMSP